MPSKTPIHRLARPLVPLLVLLSFVGLVPVSAGTLDLAVIQFNTTVEEEEINEALRGVSLARATVGDRMEVKNTRLNGVPVLFSQTTGITPGAPFGSSTRVGVQRAIVEGNTRNNTLTAKVAISEGMESGLRRFSQTVYQGRGPLSTGDPKVFGLRQIESRQPSTVKGRTRMVNTSSTVALLYQYRR
jgi:hypothetical protein